MKAADINDTLRAEGDAAVRARHDRAHKYKPLNRAIEKFNEWLALTSPMPIYATLGTVAANLLPGDPVWLGLIAPPSSAKTELLNSVSHLPYVVPAATLTPAALLSGTPKRQLEAGSKGGLLRQIGDFGILAIKDFGSILSMRPEAKAEVLAALREIYDGSWTRHLGTGGGRTLSWRGKVGLIFCCTEAYDAHYSVIGSLGDRFLLDRLGPSSDQQFKMALKHTGAATKTMREELAIAVTELFSGKLPTPQQLQDNEREQMRQIVELVVRLRGTVERDRFTREIERVHDAEGPGRLTLSLERLLAGLDTLALERWTAFNVIKHVALSSTPPTRRRAFEFLSDKPQTTIAIADKLRLPKNTTQRALEELVAHDLAVRIGYDKTHLWTRAINSWTPANENGDH